MSNLKNHYINNVVPKLLEEFKKTSPTKIFDIH